MKNYLLLAGAVVFTLVILYGVLHAAYPWLMQSYVDAERERSDSLLLDARLRIRVLEAHMDELKARSVFIVWPDDKVLTETEYFKTTKP